MVVILLWTEEEIVNYLKKNLSMSRFNHSISVSKTAISLAEKNGVDARKAKIAGLVHDCGKNLKDEELLSLITKHGYEIGEISRECPQLLHGLAGAVIAKDLMGVYDSEILDAITYHTTGRRKMSTLEKIIYISDYIEPLRDFPGVQELRVITNENLDKGMLKALDNTITYVISKGQLLQKDTIDARNFLLIKIAGENK